jgi:predicted transcriptional regulator
MKHRGEIVEKAVRQSGYSITQLAKRIGKSRRHVYNLFENPQLAIEVVIEIGRVIHHDFTLEIDELKRYQISSHNETVQEIHSGYLKPEETVDFWKNKYLLLLEKYNGLLEKKSKEQQ